MHRRDWRKPLLGLAIAAVVAAVVVIVAVTRDDPSEHAVSSGVKSDVAQTIRTHGATLAAEVITPNGHGPAPLIVMPGAWGPPATSYRAVGRQFARVGYQVVAYAERGFGGSTGKADFAGPGSQRDVRDVIDWSLAHTRASPEHIGLFGTSYGAGISLLAAAHDRRIKAVAALSTWADVATTYDPAGTPSTTALAALIGLKARPNFDSTVRHLQSVLRDSPARLGRAVRQISADRSPATFVKELNRNDPAIFIANAFEDSIFSPAQLVPFFTALTTPKRLQLAPGDHGSPERTGLQGGPNETLDDVQAWFDHFLRGTANGVDQQPPIVLHDGRTGELHSYQAWPLARAHDRAPLGPPGTETQTGEAATTWRATIASGVDSGATSGPMQLATTTTAYRPPTALIKLLRPNTAFVWSGPTLLNGLGLRGSPRLQFRLAASKPKVSLFVYLYDVTAGGVGTLIDVQPYTATGLQAGTARYVTISMQPTCWSVPAGHHLTLVVDTVDPRYFSMTPPKTTVIVSSTPKQEAAFTAPSAG